MKERILITGGTGMLARRMGEKYASKYDIRYLTRKVTGDNQFEWNVSRQYMDQRALDGVRHIVHLAGAGIADKRWTTARKQQLLRSRVDTAKLILDELKKNDLVIDKFISASAIGYYGTANSDKIYTEDDVASDDFLGRLCKKWEDAAHGFSEQGASEHTVILRLGVILSDKGGALMKMARPIQFGLGSPLASGRQYMPWTHLDDAVRVIDYAISNVHASGTFNVVAPEHITNKQLTKKLAQILKKPLWMPHVPDFILYMMFGDMSKMITKGSRVSGAKLVSHGYHFTYAGIEQALRDIYGQ